MALCSMTLKHVSRSPPPVKNYHFREIYVAAAAVNNGVSCFFLRKNYPPELLVLAEVCAVRELCSW